jgi:putative Mg2+ transporter-C (MgtC) family protein
MIMHNIQYFVDPTSMQLLKLVIAMLLGGLIGTERAVIARQSAGTRTFGLVSMGACLFVLVGNFVDTSYVGLVNLEPLQIAGSIVVGVGFIGGGLIIFRGDTLHGITTAAGLWIAAALGIAVGFGMYDVAIFATLLTLIMFVGMWYVEEKFKSWFEGHTAPPPHHMLRTDANKFDSMLNL